MSSNPPRAKHDEAYKLLFSSAAMVEDLLSHVLPEFAERIDMATLRVLSSSFVKAESLQQRHADMLWQVRLREHGRHLVYLALEFQSTPVSNMALRVREYVRLMLIEAELTGESGPARPPIVVPIVIYNGSVPWHAATDLADWIVPNADAVFVSVLGLQMQRKYLLVDLKAIAPADLQPDSWFSVLVEWESARWARDAARMGQLWMRARESGDEGIVRGFGALRKQLATWLRIPEPEPGESQSRERRKTMIRHEETWLADNLRKRDEELRQEGRQEGRKEGRLALLRQLALREFGPEGLAELSPVLDEPSDPDRDGALARAIIECKTVAELVARARKL